MSKQLLITIGIIVAIVVVGGVLLSTGDRNGSSSDVSGSSTSSDAFVPDLIDAAHQYNTSENLHIVAGEVSVPTPCHVLDTDVTVAESFPEQVSINFSTRVEDSEQMCAQVITQRRFKVTFSASEQAMISATFNGQDVELNLREVGEDENLEEFEVYTKG
ncbi:MAG: hypothetical protein WD552_01355 [Candidatus Paceibacterota bacterium]